jgi:hypothetical protein
MKGDFFLPFASESQTSHTAKDTFHKTVEPLFLR